MALTCVYMAGYVASKTKAEVVDLEVSREQVNGDDREWASMGVIEVSSVGGGRWWEKKLAVSEVVSVGFSLTFTKYKGDAVFKI